LPPSTKHTRQHTRQHPPKKTHQKINWRLSDELVRPDDDAAVKDPAYRASTRAMIFLGYTSNLISAGVREQIRCACLFVLCVCWFALCVCVVGGGGTRHC
jgi:hypothetical protein